MIIIIHQKMNNVIDNVKHILISIKIITLETMIIYCDKGEYFKILGSSKNLQVDGCRLKENLFGQSMLLINATYIVIVKVI